MTNLTKWEVKKLFIGDSGFQMKRDALDELYSRLGIMIEQMGQRCVRRIQYKTEVRERKTNFKSITLEDILDIFDLKIVEVKE